MKPTPRRRLFLDNSSAYHPPPSPSHAYYAAAMTTEKGGYVYQDIRLEKTHVLGDPGLSLHPCPRAPRGKSLPRPLAAIALATRVRRPGDRAGAGGRLPHR